MRSCFRLSAVVAVVLGVVAMRQGIASEVFLWRKREESRDTSYGEALLTSLGAGVRLHPSRRLGLASALVSRALAQVLSAFISWRR